MPTSETTPRLSQTRLDNRRMPRPSRPAPSRSPSAGTASRTSTPFRRADPSLPTRFGAAAFFAPSKNAPNVCSKTVATYAIQRSCSSVQAGIDSAMTARKSPSRSLPDAAKSGRRMFPRSATSTRKGSSLRQKTARPPSATHPKPNAPAQTGNKVEPVPKLGNELAGEQIAEIAISADQLAIGQRPHLDSINGGLETRYQPDLYAERGAAGRDVGVIVRVDEVTLIGKVLDVCL